AATSLNLTQSDWPILRRAQIRRLDQGHSFQIVTSVDGRFTAGFERNEQLGHSADESIREPTLGPDRSLKLQHAFRRVANRGGRRIRIFAPADVADGQAVRALDSPLDADVGRATFPRRARPGVVNADATQAVGVFEDIRADAIWTGRSEEHMSELQSRGHLVCRLLLEKKKK